MNRKNKKLSASDMGLNPYELKHYMELGSDVNNNMVNRIATLEAKAKEYDILMELITVTHSVEKPHNDLVITVSQNDRLHMTWPEIPRRVADEKKNQS